MSPLQKLIKYMNPPDLITREEDNQRYFSEIAKRGATQTFRIPDNRVARLRQQLFRIAPEIKHSPGLERPLQLIASRYPELVSRSNVRRIVWHDLPVGAMGGYNPSGDVFVASWLKKSPSDVMKTLVEEFTHGVQVSRGKRLDPKIAGDAVGHLLDPNERQASRAVRRASESLGRIKPRESYSYMYPERPKPGVGQVRLHKIPGLDYDQAHALVKRFGADVVYKLKNPAGLVRLLRLLKLGLPGGRF